MAFIETPESHLCRHCNKQVTAWYAQPSDGRVIFSGKCRACFTAARAVRVAAAKHDASARGLLGYTLVSQA